MELLKCGIDSAPRDTSIPAFSGGGCVFRGKLGVEGLGVRARVDIKWTKLINSPEADFMSTRHR